MLSGTFLSPLLIGRFARVSFAEVTVCCAFLCFFPPSVLAAQMFLCYFDFGLPHSPVCLSNQQSTKKMFSPVTATDCFPTLLHLPHRLVLLFSALL